MKKYNIAVRVYFEDTDAGGIVYHANYLKYMERARTDWVRSLGLNQQVLLEQNIAFVVKDMQIDFKKSAILDEELDVNCELVKLGNASMLLSQHIINKKQQTIVSASVKIACVDFSTAKPIKMPGKILRVMRSES